MNNTRIRMLMLAIIVPMLLAACDSGTPTPTPIPTATPAPTQAPAATPTIASVDVPSATPGAQNTPLTMDTSVQVARRIITQLVSEDYSGAVTNFNVTMAVQLPADKMQEIWQAIIAQLGAFKEQGEIHTGHQDIYDIVIVTCSFEKGMLDFRVVVDNEGHIAGFFYQPSESATPGATPASNYTPPNYVQESSFTEKELTFGDPEWVLTGTLTMPNSPGPHPAVVLVHGSGPLDRDETIGDNKPFRDLAWGLASQGVAVFRYDKRTFVYGQKMLSTLGDKITVQDEVVDDAAKALELVSGIEGVEPSRVFLLGHSLGAMLAPIIAEATAAESGFIAMSAPSRPFQDVILDQITYLANLDGTVTADEQTQLDALKIQVANVDTLAPGSTMAADQLPLGLPVPYWLSIKGYQPAVEASKLDESMLILQGERDYQVTMVDFAGWQETLKDKEDATLKSYPGLNHLYAAGSGPPTPDDYNKEGHVAESVINDIAAWIGRH